MRTTGIRLLVAVQLLMVAGCRPGPDSSQDVTGKNLQPVIAFVAASTRDAVQEIAAAFTLERKTDIKINADDSSKLAMQISAEAPAHLFLSANEKWADFVKEKGFADETKVLLGNSLVIVVPKGNPAGVKIPKDLASQDVKRLGVAGPTVPAGMYARQALKKLAIWNSLAENKVVPGENVRATLAYVERGEVDAGIVYATDARISDKVETVYTFDPAVHDPIRYPLVLLKEGRKNAAAHAFYDYLQTASAGDVFKKHGFTFLGGN
jgi:molybdate transport system substrate-binding protein